jgi:hypothetical protein
MAMVRIKSKEMALPPPSAKTGMSPNEAAETRTGAIPKKWPGALDLDVKIRGSHRPAA